MSRPWWPLLAMLPAWLAACAPQQAGEPQPSSTPKLIEGGVVEGRFVRGSLELALPTTPTAISRDGDTLWVAYPFQLLRYRSGILNESIPLPGTPKFMKAKPQLVLGIGDRVFVPGRGSLPYKAKDAIGTSQGVLWIDDKGLYLERSGIVEGSFDLLAGNEQVVYAFSKDALRFPDLMRIPLPGAVKAAVVLDDLYVLTKEGIYHLTRDGLQLGFRAGSFEGLEGDGTRLYTLEAGRLVKLSLNLDVLALVPSAFAFSLQPSTFGPLETP